MRVRAATSACLLLVCAREGRAALPTSLTPPSPLACAHWQRCVRSHVRHAASRSAFCHVAIGTPPHRQPWANCRSDDDSHAARGACCGASTTAPLRQSHRLSLWYAIAAHPASPLLPPLRRHWSQCQSQQAHCQILRWHRRRCGCGSAMLWPTPATFCHWGRCSGDLPGAHACSIVPSSRARRRVAPSGRPQSLV